MLKKGLVVSVICLLCIGMGGFSQGTTQQEDTPSPGPLDYVSGTYLITTNWSQYGIYNDRCPYYLDPSEDPITGNCRLGCWSVAFAQIIRYFELQPEGSVIYYCSHNIFPPLPLVWPSLIVNPISTHDYDWSLMPNTVTNSSPKDEKDMTSQFTFDVACVVQKDFGTGSYINAGEDNMNLMEALLDHFDGITMVAKHDQLTISQIEGYLDNCIPIMLYIRSTGNRLGTKEYHAVALDGYQWNDSTFEVHLNYGWGGTNNGWYAYDGPFPDYDDTEFREGYVVIADPPTQLTQAVQTGLIHTPYTYKAKTTHRNVSVVYYQFDWGDGSMSDWIGRYEPGVWCNASHRWNESGVYPVKVRASDMAGWRSNWSASRPFYIPKNPRILPIIELFFKLIDRFPRFKPLLVPLIERLCQ